MYEAKEAEFPEPDQFREIERVVLLRVIDQKWMEEIDDMLDEAEAAFEAGDYLTQDEVFHRDRNAVAL